MAIDGSKFKAVNNRDRNFTLAKMKRRAEEIDKSIERYLRQLDAMDQGSAVVTEAQTTRLKERSPLSQKKFNNCNPLKFKEPRLLISKSL